MQMITWRKKPTLQMLPLHTLRQTSESISCGVPKTALFQLMKRPQVSIVVPCYNAGIYLAAAINSALEQSHPSREVIVIDDGSSDGSLDVIKGFGSRIRSESGPNRGGNYARNRGLVLAQGQFCQFLDGDDLLDSNKVEVQLKLFEADPSLDYLVGVARIWRGDFPQAGRAETWGPPHGGDLITEWLRGTIAQTNTMLWRTGFLRSIGGWNEDFPSHQDNEVVLRAMMAGGHGVIDPVPRSTWRKWSPLSVSSDPRTKSAHSWIRLTELFHQWVSRTPGMRDYSSEMAESVWSSIRPIAATSPAEAHQIVQQGVADGRLGARHWEAGGRYGRLAKRFGFGVTSALHRLTHWGKGNTPW
jgi:hypothetical protein